MSISKSTRKKRVPTKKAVPTKRSELRSGFEFKVLQSLKSQGVSFEYETEKLEYVVPEHTKRYIPDFIVMTRSGKKVYIEAKGVLDSATKAKMLYVIQQNPNLDIRLLFMRDNYFTKRKKTKYTDWCKKHGIPFAVSPNGTVPEEWICE